MTYEEIYNCALRKQNIIVQNSNNDFYKSDEYLFILIKDIFDSLKFSKYCIERMEELI